MEEKQLPTKDYKYKLELAEDIITIKRVYRETKRQNWEIRRGGRKGFFKATLNIREKDLKILGKTASEYGEFIASLIGKKVGFPICDVEIVKKKLQNSRSNSKRTAIIPGCISYSDLAPGETLEFAIAILAWYKSEHREEYFNIMDPLGKYDRSSYRISPDNSTVNNNLELIIPAFEAYIKEICAGSQEKCDEIKQNIIEMVVFDCILANRDRNDENYGLGIDTNGNVRFYPMFDNEYILGFSEVEDDIKKYSAARLQEHINKDLYSTMGISSQPTKLGSAAVMTYLFTTYPYETKKAYDKMAQFTDNDLIQIMDECEGLSELHNAYALKIFRLRQRELQTIKEEYFDVNGNLTMPNILPGNKPMEIIRTRSSSKKSGRQAPSLDD